MSVKRRDRWTSGWCSRRRRSARIRRSSAISPRRPRDSATVGCWYTTMCSAPCTPTAIRRCPARTPSTIRSTSRSCCSASSPPARRRSSSGSPCSSCRSGRPPWWPSRPPRWTCSPPAGWCLPSAPAGTHVEYESLGASFEGRGRRLDEQVDLLRLLWRQPVVDYRGEFHRIDRAGLSPRPVRGDIPLYFGGGAEASLKRAARTGDGFVFGSASPHTHQRAGGCASCWPSRAGTRTGSRWTR